MAKSTITINGNVYDAVTGQAVDGSGKSLHQRRVVSDISPIKIRDQIKTKLRKDREPVAQAQAMHNHLQKAQTLQRQALKKPTPESKRSPMISRFAKHNKVVEEQKAENPVKTERAEVAPIHPMVAKAIEKKTLASTPNNNQTKLSGSELKEKLIKERLEEVKEAPHKKERPHWVTHQPKFVTIACGTLGFLLLGGFLTYITLPSISLKVAASRAGVDATLPDYEPEGYSIDGPISYNPGEVVISYKSETDGSEYTLSQKSTNWDSKAVLDNYVTEKTGSYITYQEKGVTVYTFNDEAIWVNGGILYTITGDAGLSADQIMDLATSI